MPKPAYIDLFGEHRIPILFENRSVLAIDKPAGWMLVPLSWQNTGRNLHAALLSSLTARHFWARSRNLKFLRYIHRLDADTSGILLLARSLGALRAMEDLFETRRMEKVYLAVTERPPKERAWTCRLALAPDPKQIGRMIAHPQGKPAETEFRLLASRGGKHLIEARPYTGRTHQIRVHLAQSGCPASGDPLYGAEASTGLGLRAVGLAYLDPFTRKPVRIRAPVEEFLDSFGFADQPHPIEFDSTKGGSS